MSKNKHIRSTIDKPAGLMVLVQNGNIEKALKKLKNKCKKEGIIQDLEKKRQFDKPSILRARAKAIAIKRHRKENAKRLEENGF